MIKPLDARAGRTSLRPIHGRFGQRYVGNRSPFLPAVGGVENRPSEMDLTSNNRPPTGTFESSKLSISHSLLADGLRLPSIIMIGELVSLRSAAAFFAASKALAFPPICPTSTTT